MPRTRIGAPFAWAKRRGATARAGSETSICRRVMCFMTAHDNVPAMKNLAFFLLLVVSVSMGQIAPARVTVFEGARLITGDGSAIENSAFVVDGSQFTRVGRRGEIQVPRDAQHVNLTGKTVMPGKVDLHGHFGYQHDWDGTMAKEYFTREN